MGAAIGLAVMVLMGYIQLTIISDEVVSLQNQLRSLQTENVTLTAQHEQMFDLATVKEVAEAAGMSKPSSSQIYYIDLSGGRQCRGLSAGGVHLLSRLLTSLNHGSTPWWNISSDGRTIMKQRWGVRRGLLTPCFGIAYGLGIGPRSERRTGMTDKPRRKSDAPAGRTR